MAKILVIDDDPTICRILSELTQSMGHEASEAHSMKEGMHLSQATPYDLIFLDIQFPEGNGLKILPDLLKAPSAPEVIIITGSGVQGAELAFKYGAWDYIRKPFLLPEISLPISRALQYRKEKVAVKPPVMLKRSEIIGESPAITECLDAVGKASVTDAAVLITGETGTGKELFAHAIHENSNRAAKDFIVVDCGALPDTLAEGLVFGHEKGSFTGADRRRKGLVEQAEGGTLFLDEVGDLPLPIQKAFLRVLQEKQIRPLGAKREINVDFRVVAATNCDLEKMVKQSLFREDLLFRLRGFEIRLPPLRERQEDIHDISIRIIQRLCRQYNMEMKGISREFFDALNAQFWHGNVRELLNVLEHSLASAVQDATLVPKHMPHQYRTNLLMSHSDIQKEMPEFSSPLNPDQDLPPLKEYRKEMEREYLHLLLDRAKGNRKKACALSGISQSQLYTLLKKHHLPGFKS